MLGPDVARKITIKNFHSFALQILLRHSKDYDILGRGSTSAGGLTVIDEKEQYEYVATAYCRIKEVESFKKGQKLESLIPREALNCGQDLCDDDDNSNLNGLEDHLKRDLKLCIQWLGSSVRKLYAGLALILTCTGNMYQPDYVAQFLKYIKLAKSQCKYPFMLNSS